jgi:protoheme IX farnesyltransferase
MERNHAKTEYAPAAGGLSQVVRDFGLLVKFRLSLLVLYSALMSYAIVAGPRTSWVAMAVLALGGFLVTGAANALNQVLERDYDRLMTRTADRPVAAGRMSVSKAVLWAGLMALSGVTLLALFNPLASFIGMASLISYAFVYTPMKRLTPLAVVVGAVPGALPLIIGCAAFEGRVSAMALFLFTMQFLWQFPHFWAVAWLADEDYKRAGFYLLPTPGGQRTAGIGLLSLAFCGLLMLNTGLAFALGLVGPAAMIALQALNAYFAWRCWQLFQTNDRAAARRQMFASFLHLPLTLIAILIDKLAGF